MKQFSVSFSQIDDAPVDRVDADSSCFIKEASSFCVIISALFGCFPTTNSSSGVGTHEQIKTTIKRMNENFFIHNIPSGLSG